MPSIATKRAVLAAVVTLASAVASAGDKPPRYVVEPVLGLRLDAGIKLEALPADVSTLCSRDSENWIYHERIFARAQNAATTYYVASGYAQRRNPNPGQSLYSQ